MFQIIFIVLKHNGVYFPRHLYFEHTGFNFFFDIPCLILKVQPHDFADYIIQRSFREIMNRIYDTAMKKLRINYSRRVLPRYAAPMFSFQPTSSYILSRNSWEAITQSVIPFALVLGRRYTVITTLQETTPHHLMTDDLQWARSRTVTLQTIGESPFISFDFILPLVPFFHIATKGRLYFLFARSITLHTSRYWSHLGYSLAVSYDDLYLSENNMAASYRK